MLNNRNALLIITTTLYIFTMTPFLFTEFATVNFRIAVFLISALIFLRSTKLATIGHITIFIVLLIWVYLYLTTSDANNFDDRVHRIITTSAIYLWAILLHRSLWFNERIRTVFITYYIKMTGLLAAFSLLSVAYYSLFGEYFFSLDLTNNYHYIITPFGVMIPKNFFGIDFLRGFSYFAEPVFGSVIFAGNFFISKQIVGDKLNLYRILSIAAGILLFSYAFYLFFFYFYLTMQRKKIKIWYVVILFVMFIVYSAGVEIMSASSMGVRSSLVELFLSEVGGWGAFEWMFGMTNSSIEQISFSGGLMQLIWDYGLLGFMVYLLLTFVICNQSYILFGAMLITTLIVDPSICPIYYLMLTVFGVILTSRDKWKAIDPTCLAHS